MVDPPTRTCGVVWQYGHKGDMGKVHLLRYAGSRCSSVRCVTRDGTPGGDDDASPDSWRDGAATEPDPEVLCRASPGFQPSPNTVIYDLWESFMMAESQSVYTPTKRTIPARKPERLSYDVAAVNAVLDEALVCHVAYQVDGIPAMIPTLHVRVGDQLYIHGSTVSRLMRAADEKGIPLCIGVTLTDGL